MSGIPHQPRILLVIGLFPGYDLSPTADWPTGRFHRRERASATEVGMPISANLPRPVVEVTVNLPGDGTDDGAEISAAIASVSADSIGIVRILRPRDPNDVKANKPYRIKTPVRLRSNITLRGEGEGHPKVEGGPPEVQFGPGPVLLGDVELGDRPLLLLESNATNISILGLTLAGNGICFGIDNPGQLPQGRANNIKIRDIGAFRLARFIRMQNVDNLLVSNCRVHDLSESAVQLYGCKDSTVSGNTISNIGLLSLPTTGRNDGIYMGYCKHILVVSNRVSNCDGDAIAADVKGQDAQDQRCESLHITDNEVLLDNYGIKNRFDVKGIRNGPAGIWLEGATGVAVKGNTVHINNATSEGIQGIIISRTGNAVLSGNSVVSDYSGTLDAVTVCCGRNEADQTPISNVKVVNNVIVMNQGSRGIEISLQEQRSPDADPGDEVVACRLLTIAGNRIAVQNRPAIIFSHNGPQPSTQMINGLSCVANEIVPGSVSNPIERFVPGGAGAINFLHSLGPRNTVLRDETVEVISSIP
jgi:hypothetical protein